MRQDWAFVQRKWHFLLTVVSNSYWVRRQWRTEWSVQHQCSTAHAPTTLHGNEVILYYITWKMRCYPLHQEMLYNEAPLTLHQVLAVAYRLQRGKRWIRPWTNCWRPVLLCPWAWHGGRWIGWNGKWWHGLRTRGDKSTFRSIKDRPAVSI